MRCGRCGYAVPEWLWLGDDHPLILDRRPTTITRSDGPELNTMRVVIDTEISIQMCSDVHRTQNEGDFINIGPECFADKKALVISYKGENYYKACDAVVYKDDQGTTHHCVKRVSHPQAMHEAYDGTQKEA